MKNIFLFILTSAICHLPSDIFSQTFQRTYSTTGVETGTCIQNTLDGNYIITGNTSGVGAGYQDAFLMKVSTSGNLIWAKTYGGSSNEYSYYVTSCSDGGYILSGTTTSFGNNTELYLVRTDSGGNLLWSKTTGGSGTDIGWFVMEMSDGGFITCGQTNSFNGPTYNAYLTKHDSGGNLLWTKVFYGSSSEGFNGMSKTSDGGIIAVGKTGINSFGSSDILLIKTDSNGDTLWTGQYGKITEDEGWAVVPAYDGGYALTGDMHKDTVTPGAHNTLLLKTDSGGNMQWARTYGSNPGSEIGYDIIQNADSSYSILGNTGYYGNGSREMMMLNMDKSGTFNWARTYGYIMQDDAWQFRKTADGGYVIIAATENYFANNVWDVYLVKTDSLGLDSCFETTDSVETFLPFVQMKRGIPLSSGGTAATPATVVTNVTMQVNNPCSLVGMNETSLTENNAVVYPNPFSKEATVKIGSQQLAVSNRFILYDIFGKEIRSEAIRNSDSFVIRRDGLPSGIYFYKVRSLNETIATGKIIIK